MYAKFGKRIVDVIGATILLVVAIIPMLLIAVIIKIDSRGSALLRQKRYGKDKKPFVIYKFRTMVASAPRSMPTNSFREASHYITRVGKILRKLSFDELPQLINVIRGDMSLIGPRPVILVEKRLIKLRDQRGANAIRPGITGWAQANGRDVLDDISKAEMDGYYVEHLSLLTDVKCIIKTILVVISVAGNKEGHEVSGANKKSDDVQVLEG